MNLFFSLLFGLAVRGQVESQNRCLETITLKERDAIKNIFASCTEYAGSIDWDTTLDIDIESRKLKSIAGVMTVRGKFPQKFPELKVGTLLLQDVNEYVHRSYYNFQADELIIKNFIPDSQVIFKNLNPTFVTIEDSNMEAITGIVSSNLVKLTLKNNAKLESFVMDHLTQATDLEFNQNIKLNLTRAFPNLKEAGNISITNSGKHDFSLPLEVIYDLKVSRNAFAFLSLPHLASVHDLSVSENAISMLSLPSLEKANNIDINENKQLKSLDLSSLSSVVKIQVLDEKIKELFLNTDLKWESAKFKSPSFGQQYFRQFSGKNNLELDAPLVCFGHFTPDNANKDVAKACTDIYADVVVDPQFPKLELETSVIWGDLTFNGNVSAFTFPNLDLVHGSLKLNKTASLKSILPKITKVASLELLHVTSFDLNELQIAGNVNIESTQLETLRLGTRTIESLKVENNTNLSQLHIPKVEHLQDLSFRANKLLAIHFTQVLDLKGSLSIERSGAASIVLDVGSIAKDLHIQDNENTFYANFPYLEAIGGNLLIQNNKLLKTVDFLKVTRVTKVTLKGNPGLSELKTATETYRELEPGSPLTPQPDGPEPTPEQLKSSHALYYLLIGIPVLLLIGGAIYYFVFHRR